MWLAEAALARVMRLDWPGTSLEPINRMRDEVRALPKIVSDYVHYGMDERAIIDARLKRRFDPGPMLNETYNRAVERRKGDEPSLSGTQIAALKVQKEHLERLSAQGTKARH